MAEQIQDSTITPSAVLAAQIVSPATTGSVVSAANLPSSGTFSLVLKGTAADGSDDGIIAVGAITGTALSSITWVRNGQGTFPADTEVEYDLDARALIAYVAEQIATHAALTTAHADATNLVHTTGTETIGGAKTLSSPLLIPDGTAALPSLGNDGDPDTGLYFSAANKVALTAGGTQQLVASLAGGVSSVSITGNAIISGRLALGAKSIGATLNLANTDPGFLYVTAATCTINLFAVAWNGNTSSLYFIADPNNLLGTLTINAYDAGDGVTFNDINGADATYGAWNDSYNAVTGPFGPAATLTDTGSIWMLTYARTDTGSGATGGWVIRKLATDASY